MKLEILLGLGVLLMSFVLIEPSPSDLAFAVLIPLGVLSSFDRLVLQGKAAGIAYLLFAYLVITIPVILLAENQIASLRYHLITSYLFVFSLFLCTWIREEHFILLVRCFFAAALISFLAGFLGWLGLQPQLLMDDEFRVKGLFKDPNVFGPFFVPAILLLISDLRQRKILPAPAFLHAVLILLLTLGVIFSYSRAAWLNLGVGTAVLLFLQYRSLGRREPARLRFRILATLMVTFLLLTGLFSSPLMRDTGIPEFLLERAQFQNYDTERFLAHQGGLILLREHPFGIGPGQFKNQIDQVTHFRIDAHSLYVRTMVESGLPGLLFFAAVFLLLQGLLSGHRSGIPPDNAVLFAILAGLLVNSIVVDTIHWRHFWFFLGLALYQLNRPRRETTT